MPPTAAPSAPCGPIRHDELTETTVDLDWLPPKDDGGARVTGYTVYMSVDNGEFVEIAQTPSANLKVKKMKTGSKHVFKVIAHNSVGKSKALESDTIIPLAKKS